MPLIPVPAPPPILPGVPLQFGTQVAPSPSAYVQAVLADSPVAYWRLDETAGTVAVDQLAANPGTYATGVGGTGVTSSAGLLATESDAAIAFASSQYLNCGNPAAFHLATGTIECWVSTSQANDAGYHGIIVKSNAFGLFQLNSGNLGCFDWGTGLNRDTGLQINDGQPHHVAMTFQSGVANGTVIYLDGLSVLTTTTNWSDQTVALFVGQGGGGVQFLPGTFDEPAIYNYVLTPAQVANHYQVGSGTAPVTITATGAAISSAAAAVTAAQLVAAAAASSSTASATVTTPQLITPVASSVSAATAAVTAAPRITPAATSITAASATVTASGIPFIIPAATTTSAAAAPTTAARLITPAGQSRAAAATTVTAAQFITPTGASSSAATGPVTARPNIIPVATSVSASTALIGVPVVYTDAQTGTLIFTGTATSTITPGGVTPVRSRSRLAWIDYGAIREPF